MADRRETTTAEEALQASESKYRTLVEKMNAGVFQTTVTGTFLSVNPAVVQMAGYASVDELMSESAACLYADPADRERLVDALMRDGEVRNPEIRSRRKDGTTYWISINAVLQRDRDGRPTHILGILNDITERRETEQRLAYIGAALEATSEAIGISDAQGRHIYQNRALSELFGYATAEDLQAAGGGPAVVKDPAVAAAMFENIMHGKSWAGELEMVTREGRVFTAFETADAIFDGAGTLIGLIGVIADITARKRTEDALRLFEKLVQHSSDAIGMSTPDGRHYFQNEAFDRLFGAIGDRPPQTVYVDEAVGRQVFEAIMAGGSWAGEVEMYGKDGSIRNILLRAFPIKEDGGRILGLVGLHTDITERRHADQDKAALEAQLQQAQKLESVGRLAGGVAHDFNNMLGVILGHSEMAMDQVDPGLPLYANLAEIRAAAARSADLVRQLLAFARKQTVAPRVVDLNQVVAGSVKMLRRLIGEEIRLVSRPGPGLWPVRVDTSQVEQMLANLCVNAKDAIAGVGEIGIETGNATLTEADAADITEIAAGDYVRLAVTDNGCGMDAETQAHIFEPFFTTKGVGEGTGLGLATVYGAVHQNGGAIRVRSAPGAGTTVAIYLPRHAGGPDPVPAVAKGRSATGGGETILVVEDEPSLLKIITARLVRQGYTVIAASSPGEALDAAKARPKDIRLLITDVVMPEMDGRMLAERLRSRCPNLKALFMSGYTADIIAMHGILEDGVAFVQKPFSAEVLAAKVRELLDGAS